jgi:hypothetical protein
MKFAGVQFIDLKNVILCTVVDEVVRPVWQPAIQYRLKAMVIVRQPKHELLLHPCQLSPIEVDPVS